MDSQETEKPVINGDFILEESNYFIIIFPEIMTGNLPRAN